MLPVSSKLLLIPPGWGLSAILLDRLGGGLGGLWLLSWFSIRCGELRGKGCSQERWDGKRKKDLTLAEYLDLCEQGNENETIENSKEKELVLWVNALQLPSNVGKAGGVEWPYYSSGTRRKG